MTRDDDGTQVREGRLVRELPQNRVGEIVRRQLSFLVRRATRSPAVAVARPVHFVRGERVLAASAVGRKPRRDDDGVVERAGEKRGGERAAEIVVGIAS